MKVLNIHKRKIRKPAQNILGLFTTLSTKNDMIWPIENWPRMKFKNGLVIGSNGGHGPIRYQIVNFDPKSHIEFKFQKPTGFNGTHKFEIIELDNEISEVKHTIEMTTSGIGTISWLLVIRWLHDALLEDAFDKIENQLTQSNLKTEWSIWVKFWRWVLKPKN
ncbi:hypothetical protein [Spongiivirga citrea]|uniref:SRPBCC family protein n=1 Tax=Spongiivirga citrea TaxID=1481457 RepID=A0A6M0CN97_9FLAO|nr:hypothetical protein [Spongiivirga citrea]NER17544.1 hypothetical protein [Spongiivirga citrea]